MGDEREMEARRKRIGSTKKDSLEKVLTNLLKGGKNNYA